MPQHIHQQKNHQRYYAHWLFGNVQHMWNMYWNTLEYFETLQQQHLYLLPFLQVTLQYTNSLGSCFIQYNPPYYPIFLNLISPIIAQWISKHFQYLISNLALIPTENEIGYKERPKSWWILLKLWHNFLTVPNIFKLVNGGTLFYKNSLVLCCRDIRSKLPANISHHLIHPHADKARQKLIPPAENSDLNVHSYCTHTHAKDFIWDLPRIPHCPSITG